MKKLRIILVAVKITATEMNNVAAYKINKQTNNNELKNKFSNFYVLGDSLNDSHGIENLLKNESWPANLKVGIDEINNKEYQNGSFSNGKTAAVLLNDKLGFDKITPEIINSIEESNFGRNYAVANSTAQEFENIQYKYFFNKTTIVKQAQALVKQHKLYSTDLVLFQIGGNDIKNIFDNLKNENIDTINHNLNEKIMDYVKKSVNNIKYAIEILLNNGARKIIFSDPPNLSLIPKYQKNNSEF